MRCIVESCIMMFGWLSRKIRFDKADRSGQGNVNCYNARLLGRFYLRVIRQECRLWRHKGAMQMS